MSIFKGLFKRRIVATLDSVSFDSTGYSFKGEAKDERTWFTPSGDPVSLAFCPEPPKLPHQAQTSLDLQDFYQGRVCNEQVRMIEFSLPRLADTTCIWTALKMQRQPHGMTYMGSLLIPFAAFWFIVRMQCDERGITGVRETALLIAAQQEGKVTITADGKLAGDWSPDEQRYDEKFPDHPVSRLRREFAAIKGSLKIHDTIKNEKRFDLPTPAA